MRVAVTGGTGFTGSRTVRRLLERGHAVRCLVRRPAPELAGKENVELVQGDIADPDSLARTFQGCDALANVASLGFGHADGIIAAAQRAGIGRAAFVSTTALFTSLNAPSKQTRLAAEAGIQRSGLRWTILRPTMIYGSARDRNMCRLIRVLRRSPVFPVFGTGRGLQQPVFVDDVAEAICAALERPAAIHQAYNLPGAAPLTFNEVLQTVARLLGKRVWLWHVPMKPAIAVLQGCQRLGLRGPITAEQLLRLEENKAFDWTHARADLGYAPRSFAAGIQAELSELGLLGSQ